MDFTLTSKMMLTRSFLALAFALCACIAKPQSHDPAQGPRDLFARFITTGGTCPEGASGFFGIQYRQYPTTSSVEVVPCTSLTACATYDSAVPLCTNTSLCVGYDSAIDLISPTSAATTAAAANCGLDPECGCTQGWISYIDNHADMIAADEVSISLASAKDRVTGQCTQADALLLKDKATPCTLQGRVAASAPDVSAVVPSQLDVSACTSEISVDGNHFRPGLVIGYASSSCLGDWFATPDGNGMYCIVPVDSVTSTTITFHFDSCPGPASYVLAIMNPDHDGPSTGNLDNPGQLGYASLTIH